MQLILIFISIFNALNFTALHAINFYYNIYFHIILIFRQGKIRDADSYFQAIRVHENNEPSILYSKTITELELNKIQTNIIYYYCLGQNITTLFALVSDFEF